MKSVRNSSPLCLSLRAKIQMVQRQFNQLRAIPHRTPQQEATMLRLFVQLYGK